ncbi:MAG: cytochrome c biogenesis protein CcsA [Bdellovibrio sp.]|nr:cytochrome c biogenesis protein CcsA [Bdellovibrio sp.]
MRNRIFTFVLAILAFSLGVGPLSAAPIPSHAGWSFNEFGLIPIQSGGRIKPLDSLAREIVLFETGSRAFQGRAPSDLLLSWISFPEEWQKTQLIQVSREDVKRQLGLDEKRKFFSPQELIANPVLVQYSSRIGNRSQQVEPPGSPRSSAREQEVKSVIEKISLFHELITGQAWVLLPRPSPQPWASLVDPHQEGELIRGQFAKVIKAYQEDDRQGFERATRELRAAIEGEIPSFKTELKTVVQAEFFYNQARPFLFAWIFYLVAALLWVFLEFRPQKKKVRKVALSFTGLAVLWHLIGFGLRCYVAGRPPVTNMYESVIWVSLGVIGFALILYRLQRQGIILAVATVLAWLGLVAGDAAPSVLDSSIQPLVPVLRSNYWLTIHVLTITLGYAAFALTLGLSNISLFQFLKKAPKEKIFNLNQLTYRAMQFGVVLIAAGTILGGIWADYSWGRFWGWDPKEVWALITLLAYIVILHGRYTNWVGQFGFAAWSAVSFMTVVMAWYGVNFILGAGLHSYGFSRGGTPWVLGFVALQLAYILSVSGVYYSRKKKAA